MFGNMKTIYRWIYFVRTSTGECYVRYKVYRKCKRLFLSEGPEPRFSSPLWSFSPIHHRSLRRTSTYFPQPLNLLNMKPVTFTALRLTSFTACCSRFVSSFLLLFHVGRCIVTITESISDLLYLQREKETVVHLSYWK